MKFFNFYKIRFIYKINTFLKDKNDKKTHFFYYIHYPYISISLKLYYKTIYQIYLYLSVINLI